MSGDRRSARTAGTASALPTQTRVLVTGQPVATTASAFTIAGCPFTVPGPKPQPCVRAQWMMPATRVQVDGPAGPLGPRCRHRRGSA